MHGSIKIIELFSKLTYTPLPMDGKAIVDTFFSSARVSAFFTTVSSSLMEFVPFVYDGLYAWMMYFAFRLGASPIKAAKLKTNISIFAN